MCNLYSITKTREAVRRFFGVAENRAAAFKPLPAIYPGGDAPVIRNAPGYGERELVMASWGFVLNMKDKAPKRVTNVRDDKLKSPFWSGSFKERRCLAPVTAFAEPKGKQPAIWHWFAFGEDRPLFAFAGIWRTYKGPIRKDGDTVELEVYSFLTTKPNELVATVHPSRMPVLLTEEPDFDCWLNGSPDNARELIKTYPDDQMEIVQAAKDKKDLG